MADFRGALERLVFVPDAPRRPDRLLGWVVLGLVALVGWLIAWPFIPPVLAAIVVGLIDLLVLLWSAITALWSAIAALPWPGRQP